MGTISAAEAVCRKVAESFSRLEKPTLAAPDESQALAELFFHEPDGLTRLNEAVKRLSNGQVEVQNRTPADKFKLEVFGPAKYLVLVGGGRRQRVIFFTSDPFFIFEK